MIKFIITSYFSVFPKMRPVFAAGIFVFVSLLMLAPAGNNAWASCGCSDGFCSSADCGAADSRIDDMHEDIRENTKQHFDDDLEAFHTWVIEDFLGDQIVPAMGAMAHQLNAVGMQYVQSVGMFMDAKAQLDTQRLFQKLKYEAHKDYTPSESLCYFGTNIRSLGSSQMKSHYNSLALSRIALDRYVGAVSTSGAQQGAEEDLMGRWRVFVDTYCDAYDNNNLNRNRPPDNIRTGLEYACDRNRNYSAGDNDIGAVEAKHINRDIDYTRLVEEPRTLDVDFSDTTLNSTDTVLVYTAQSGEEQDVLMMHKNLYGHVVPERILTRQMSGKSSAERLYLAMRNVHAKRNVAQASFNAIVSLKSAGTAMENDILPALPTELQVFQNQRFMASIVKELMPTGTSDAAIYEYMGFNPSYYSQLEILAKRIYQNPTFYANLYDKPANVARKKVAMKAIELMVDREIYESQLRREMLVSVLLSSKLLPEYVSVNGAVASSSEN